MEVPMSEWEYPSNWSDLLPEPVFHQILTFLSTESVITLGKVCRRYFELTYNDYLWSKLFAKDFKVNSKLKAGTTWREEYKRLVQNVPMVLTDVLKAHSHQVLHVSFSHNGKMFATCSKDGLVIIWNSSYPSTIKYQHDMKLMSWKYTQYSQFNQSDTLLLVSGVHFGTPHATSGEIAVFSVQNGSRLKCRVMNRPYDIFGTWFTDNHLLSGDLHWLAHLVSTSVLWINKANQEVDSEHTNVMNQMYKFYNQNAAAIRAIMVANCPWLSEQDETVDEVASTSSSVKLQAQDPQSSEYRSGNPLSVPLSHPANPATVEATQHRPLSTSNPDYASPIQYEAEYLQEYDRMPQFESSFSDVDSSTSEEEIEMGMELDADEDELENSGDKYLIFSTGSKTYTPHQIGFKRIGKVNFPKKLDPGPSLKERIALRERQREIEVIINSLTPAELALQSQFQNSSERRVEPDYANYAEVQDRFDKVDKLIDLNGHIIGMCLSPCHRYLYVNSRAWPDNCVIRNPLEPPVIAQEIDIHVIDLKTLKKVGKMLRAHKAYTPNTECFFIFLDVSENYVASGAEDKFAYLWDRYYGVCLAKYQHSDVVNSVAFNPKDNEMLVTTSDDFEIKIWRSKAAVAKQGCVELGKAVETRSKN